MRRVPITPPGDMFWGQDLTGEDLTEAERGYLCESLLEGKHFSYVCTLILQLIDIIASDFIPPFPPPQADPTQSPSSRGETSQASQGHSASRVASSDPIYFLAFAIYWLYTNV